MKLINLPDVYSIFKIMHDNMLINNRISAIVIFLFFILILKRTLNYFT
jgi:hypothetical protein